MASWTSFTITSPPENWMSQYYKIKVGVKYHAKHHQVTCIRFLFFFFFFIVLTHGIYSNAVTISNEMRAKDSFFFCYGNYFYGSIFQSHPSTELGWILTNFLARSKISVTQKEIFLHLLYAAVESERKLQKLQQNFKWCGKLYFPSSRRNIKKKSLA